MNNYQWLLQMDGAERKAWFDAEHVEHQERALDGDTDALERKSADLIHEYYKPMVAELQAKVDRLTAERDNWKANCEDWKKHARAAENACYETMLEREELQAKVDELTQIAECKRVSFADRIRFVDRINEIEAERDNLKANNEQLHTLAGEQAAKIDELQSALDAICANLSIIVKGEPNVIADIAIETIKALIDECNTANRHCNEYRNKFGKCLDYADAIHALMDDEGVA